MRRRWGLALSIALAVFLGLVLVVETAILAAVLATRSQSLPFGTKVAVVRVDDLLVDPRPFVEIFRGLEKNEAVKAVVLRLESPGGSVAASQEIHEGVKRLRRSGKVVVASVGNVGASGAYYVAVGAETIVANPGSIVGSIGVLAQFLNLGDLYEKVGIDPYMVTSGRFKGMGESSRRLDAEERRLVQELIDDAHAQFVGAVIEGRRAAVAGLLRTDDARAVEARVRALADGRIFTGRQALEVGLVDRLGTHRDAIELAGRAVGAGEDPTLLEEAPARHDSDLFDRLGAAVARALGLPDLGPAAAPPPGLYYLYVP